MGRESDHAAVLTFFIYFCIHFEVKIKIVTSQQVKQWAL